MSDWEFPTGAKAQLKNTLAYIDQSDLISNLFPKMKQSP